MKRILIVTISPDLKGGVKRSVDFAIRVFLARGYAVDVAYYQPQRLAPELSISCFQFWSKRKPGCKLIYKSPQLSYHAIGARYAELEFNHYRVNPHWQRLISQADYCLVISGHLMPAAVLDELGVDYCASIASDYDDDRRARVKQFPFVKRWVDQLLVAPICRRRERKILRSKARIFPVSNQAKKSLEKIAKRPVDRVIPHSVDLEMLEPDFSKAVPWRFGFVGRLDDPRKNLELLIKAFGLVLKKQPQAQLCLVGSSLEENLKQKIAALNYAKNIEVFEKLSDRELVDFLQRLDVFVIPSHQEGFCIAGLEAMACGAVVITTPCGGPLDFIKHNQTGLVSRFDAKQLADDMQCVAANREWRDQLARQAVEFIQREYGFDKVADLFFRAIQVN